MPGKRPKKSFNPTEARLLTVCRLLNKAHAKYLVIGAQACNLYGLIRATRDVDLLIPADEGNAVKILRGLQELPLGIARELDAKQVANKPFTIIGDIPRVDLLTVAGKVKYPQALKNARTIRIQRVAIPLPDMETLLKTKNTGRLQDKADAERLRAMYPSQEKK